MKKLNRPVAPNCLKKLKASSPNKWIISDSDKSEIWQALNAMQIFFCAYCERALIEENCHIEHLTPQYILKKLKGRSIYEWSNLFGSCDHSDHCGRYKDEQVTDYDATNLIRPDTEDPARYLVFLPNGHIVIKDNLDESGIIKATETIRVLNLESSRLVNLRQKKISEFQMRLSELRDLIECSNGEDDEEIIRKEIMSLQHDVANSEYYLAVFQNTTILKNPL